jgi:conjugal transfer pilus assembly protein TraD
MLSVRRYEMPWRRAYELYAALAWAGGGVLLGVFAEQAGAALSVPLALSAVSLIMALYRGRQALRLLRLRAALSGRAMETISTRRFRTYCRDPEQLFLGFGFEWQPVHSQRLYELAKVPFRDWVAPAWLLRAPGARRAIQPDAEIGLPYIHGVEPVERALHRPLQNFEGGTLIVGTTQSGKGVTLAVLAAQAVYRGDVVIVIDPKNSKRLKGNVLRACQDAGRSDAFVEFHPAFPERGIRFDPLFNWQKPTELASRIQAVMPPDTTGSFSAFGWDAINVVVQGLVDLEDRPSLTKLARCIEGGIEGVLLRSLERHLAAAGPPGWRELARAYIKRAAEGKLRRPADAASDELVGYVTYYERDLAPHRRTPAIDAQLRIYHHPREHYQKITANLLPILAMLTSGDLGRSLSPDPLDVQDTRPILNLDKIVRARRVFYVALDALPDPAVGGALGAILLADLAALAGMRYNLDAAAPRISLFVDEIADVINQPLIQILNKGAESGIYTTCAMQTLADLADRLGSEEAARRAVGNLNNLFALRSKDRPTQDFIVETFGKTPIHSVEVALGTHADGRWPDFSGSRSRRLRETREETIPADILGKLPNLQYFALVSGGRLLKGRVPILDSGAQEASAPPATAAP